MFVLRFIVGVRSSSMEYRSDPRTMVCRFLVLITTACLAATATNVANGETDGRHLWLLSQALDIGEYSVVFISHHNFVGVDMFHSKAPDGQWLNDHESPVQIISSPEPVNTGMPTTWADSVNQNITNMFHAKSAKSGHQVWPTKT